MLTSAERILAVFAPPSRSFLVRGLDWCSESKDRGCSQLRIHLYEQKNDNTLRSVARRWLLLVKPGSCTGYYDRNDDKRRIHGIRSGLRDDGRQKRSWQEPVALFRDQTDDDC